MLASGGATAQMPTAIDSPAKPRLVADKKVCRVYQTTGSIMPGKRVCHSAAEWAAIDGTQDKATQQFQDHLRSNAPGGSRGG